MDPFSLFDAGRCRHLLPGHLGKVAPSPRRVAADCRNLLLEGPVDPVLLSDLFIGPEDLGMSTKFSEDVIPLTDLKVNPGRVVKHATDAHRPVLLTRRGRGVAVVQAVIDYETAEEERAFMRAVVGGLADLEAGRESSLADAKARLGLK